MATRLGKAPGIRRALSPIRGGMLNYVPTRAGDLAPSAPRRRLKKLAIFSARNVGRALLHEVVRDVIWPFLQEHQEPIIEGLKILFGL